MKKAILLLAVISLFATSALAKTQALIRKDGRKHVGIVTKTASGYNVKMRAGNVSVPADQVARIEDAQTPAEDFRAQLATIPSTNIKARYKLAKSAFKKGLLSEARGVLKDIVKADPEHERAKLLIEEIDAKSKGKNAAQFKKEFNQRLAAVRDKDADGFLSLAQWAYDNELYSDAKTVLDKVLKIDPAMREAAVLLNKTNAKIQTVAVTKTGPVDSKDNLVSLSDIYGIRLAEFRRKGDMVRVKYRNDVIKEFTKAMNGRDDFQDDMRFGDKFRGYKSVRQLQYILDPDRDIDPDVLEKLKKDILIESDPMSIKIFRARVWPAVRVNCATSACHGSAEGVGGLKLFNVSARDTRVAYTNFAILAGISTKKSARILDRDNIEDSLLLQYLLPATQAKTPHPKTKKPLRTLFRDNRHPTYKMFVKWIGSLAGPGYPNYNMKYKVPFGMKLELGGGGGALPDRPRDRK